MIKQTTSKILLTANCLALFSVLESTAQNTKPNILLILADDLGYGDVSALNENSKIKTPAIDQLSKNGIRFTDAHSNSSVSTPSRYGILTGRYAFRTLLKQSVLNGFSEPLIAPERSTLASMLSKEGYITACIGKWHLGWEWAKKENCDEIDYSRPISNGPVTRGFDYFFGIASSLDMPPYVYVERDTPTAIPNRISKESKGLTLFRSGPQAPDFEPEDCLPNFTQRAVEYITNRKGDNKSFFLYLPLTAPHTPILPSKEFEGKSGLSSYADFVMMVDDAVGKIISALKASGQYQNTIIVFTSDNGCYRGAGMDDMEKQGHHSSYIYRGAKSDIFDGGHRIPLIISWGDKYNNRIEKGLISLTDFYATFAQMTGYKPVDNEGEDSHSFWPVLSCEGKPSRTDVVHHSIDGSFSLREGDWKLIFCPGSGGWSYPSLPKDKDFIATLPGMQLYDIKKDPGETNNLINKYPATVEKLKRKMQDYILNGRSTPGRKQNNEISGKWKQIENVIQNY
ncbi:MAG: arylsulfatase [Dysgonamonadaceae bacterium]|jgi:arylsulfatase A-like enzyme|nr:arylsulfatase [Dysgonamonadaceae bacterium]